MSDPNATQPLYDATLAAPPSGETRSTVRCQKCGHTGAPSPTVVLDLEAEIRELKAEIAARVPSSAPATTEFAALKENMQKWRGCAASPPISWREFDLLLAAASSETPSGPVTDEEERTIDTIMASVRAYRDAEVAEDAAVLHDRIAAEIEELLIACMERRNAMMERSGQAVSDD